jgi:ABC-type glycerol-3-phosphate transport system permease component
MTARALSRGETAPAACADQSLVVYCIAFMSLFYLLPMYVMLVTGFKSFEEVSLKTMWDCHPGCILTILWRRLSSLRLICGTVFAW